MSRFYLTLTAGLSITLVTACSQSNEADIASPSSEAVVPKAELEEDASAIVVTGQKASVPLLESPMPISVVSSERVASTPPMARQVVVTGTSIAPRRADPIHSYYQDESIYLNCYD